MRKCPQCRKAVPVGARRCVYCRASVEEVTLGKQSLGGYGVQHDSFEDEANSTSFGKPGSKNFSHAMNNDFKSAGPQHTLLGLGPVALGSGRTKVEEEEERFGQTTMVGMPGVVFEQTGGIGTNKISIATPKLEEKLLANKSDRITTKAEEHEVKKPETESSDADDPLFGLLGVVAPKPSSLIDEEFTDLSHEVFGDDFNFKLDDDDDVEGWDFDFEIPSAKPVEARKVPAVHPPAADENLDASLDTPIHIDMADVVVEEERASAKEESTNVQPASVDAVKAESKLPVGAFVAAQKAEKPLATETESVPEREVKPKREQAKTELRDAAPKAVKLNPIEALLITLTALMSVLWVIVPSHEFGSVFENLAYEPKNIALIGFGAFSALAALFSLQSKISNAVRLALLVLAALALVAGIVIAPIGQWHPHRAILGGAAVLAVVCAIIQLFKKQ
ncbi:MAG: hypothetical protein WC966_06340 [Bradymonadales bacterium]|jgi:hypothetical protein